MTGPFKESPPSTEGKRDLVLPTPEALLLPRWFNALHDAASDFTDRAFSQPTNSPLSLTEHGLAQMDDRYTWNWREDSPVRQGDQYARLMLAHLRPVLEEGKLTGRAGIYLIPETYVTVDGKMFEVGDLENRNLWRSWQIDLGTRSSEITTVVQGFSRALDQVWSEIGEGKKYAAGYIEHLRKELSVVST